MAAADERNMLCAVEAGKDRALGKALVKFGKIVEKESGGGIKVRVFTDGVIGSDRQTLETLQMGTVHCASVSTEQIGVFVPQFTILDLPFLFKDKSATLEALDGPVGKALLDRLPAAGLVGVNFWENGYRHLSNNGRQIGALADIRGLKLGTVDNPVLIETWRALGADPTPMVRSQVYSALRKNTLDGQESSLGDMVAGKLYEVQKYVTTTGHIYSAKTLVFSKKFWDALSDEEKTLVRQAAWKAQAYQRQLNEKEERDSASTLAAKGVKIGRMSVGERKRIVAALRPVYGKYLGSLDKDLADSLRTAGH